MIVKGVSVIIFMYVKTEVSQSVQVDRCVAIVLGVLQFCT